MQTEKVTKKARQGVTERQRKGGIRGGIAAYDGENTDTLGTMRMRWGATTPCFPVIAFSSDQKPDPGPVQVWINLYPGPALLSWIHLRLYAILGWN